MRGWVNAMPDTTTAPSIPSEYSDDAEMVDIVEMFVEDMPRRLEALAAAWECMDVECVRRLAHQLKGAAAGYGYPRLTERARALEDLLRDPEDESAEAVLRRASAEYQELIDLCGRVVVR
jgi:HPt (histidine-containing phosphotransfer) domain-containing protein